MDVLRHGFRVHADQSDGQCFGDKLDLNVHGFSHNAFNGLFFQLAVEEAGKVGVQTLVPADEFVGEA